MSSSSGISIMRVATFLWLCVMFGRSLSLNRRFPFCRSLTVSMAQGHAVMPMTWTPIIFFSPLPLRLVALAMSLNDSMVFLPDGTVRSRK